VQRISREDLRTRLDAGTVTLVEALPEPHYHAEHLPGAVNLPGQLTADLAATLAPDRTQTVVTYCSGPSCGRSKVTAAAFTRLGYADVRVYEGGKTDWAEAGLRFEGARAMPEAA
jgi:rhodanese-related sulfurtransferase